MPKAIKKKVPKKDTEEEVKDKLAGLRDEIKERQKTIVKYGALILAILIVVTAFFIYDYTSKKKARVLQYEAYRLYHGDYQKQPANSAEQYRQALDIFKKAYDTRKSPIILLYIAGCYYELGRYDEALMPLNDFIRRYSKQDKLTPLAYQKMSLVHIKMGNKEEAKKTLDSLYNLKGDIYKDFVLIEYARLLEKEGRPEEAKKKYEELMTRFPHSPFSDEAKAKAKAKVSKKKG